MLLTPKKILENSWTKEGGFEFEYDSLVSPVSGGPQNRSTFTFQYHGCGFVRGRVFILVARPKLSPECEEYIRCGHFGEEAFFDWIAEMEPGWERPKWKVPGRCGPSRYEDPFGVPGTLNDLMQRLETHIAGFDSAFHDLVPSGNDATR